MSTVLVTGGAGFIGSHLARTLRDRGHVVRVLDTLEPQIHGAVPQGLDWLRDAGFEVRRGSVTSHDDVASALEGADAVVHLAAETGTGQSMYQIARYTEVNTKGSAVVLDVLANDESRSVRRVVLASSRSVYGEGAYVCEACPGQPRQTPPTRSAAQLAAHDWQPRCADCGRPMTAMATRETDPVRPASIYAASKLAQEDLVRIACDAMGIDHVVLRLQNVYGEGQSLHNPYTGILSIFSTRIRRGLPLPIFEDGEETRDFVHVDDVARAFAAALASEKARGAVINVGTGIGSSVGDIAARLADAFAAARNVVVTGQYRLGDIRHNRADIARMRDLLGVAPAISLADGLGRFAAWVSRESLPEDRLDAANAELKVRRLMG